VKLPRHGLFGLLLFFHGLFQLPSQHALDGDGLDLFPDSFLLQKAIEA
jgi:hypothetical protein